MKSIGAVVARRSYIGFPTNMALICNADVVGSTPTWTS